LQEYLYSERRHLLYLPNWVYFPSRYSFFYQEDLLVFRYLFQKEAKNASRIFQKFLEFRQENQKEWLFYRIDQREILERMYLEAIFCQRKAKVLSP
jgi:competence protein CoiA